MRGAAVLLLVLTTQLVTARAQVPLPTSGYWHTAGTTILDVNGQMVRIAAVTWYGMESDRWVPAGLNFQPYTTIMDTVKLLGYNTIRLPFSNELVERNPTVQRGVAANPLFRGIPALNVMDAIVAYAETIGLKIILDNHRSRAPRPMQVNTLDETLWYAPGYGERAWIHDWQTLAQRYLGNDAVIGVDLRNEPHTAGSGPWTVNAYLHRGATWGPYRGVANPATDWRQAAERAGNAVLAINPRLLIIVEGLPLYPVATAPNGVASSWWAGLLIPVRQYPVRLNVPHQLVYSVHQYGPRKYSMPWFRRLTYRALHRVWHNQFAFLLHRPAAPYAVPLFLGEFGTCSSDPQCVTGTGSQGVWFQALVRFLREHRRVGWGFYALNGTNSNDCAANNGLLNWAWNAVASPDLQASLMTIQPAPPAVATIGGAGSLVPGASTAYRPRSPKSRLCLLP